MYVYVSPACPNCKRLLDIIRHLKLRIEVVDIDTLDSASRARLQYVPMLVDENNRTHTGSDAFKYLEKYNATTDLVYTELNGKLAYAAFDGDDDGVQYVEPFGTFPQDQ